jgi:cytochrome c-type biogenesis protein CcmH
MIRTLLLMLIVLAQPALALSPSEQLKDPALEQRARDVSAELRCLVCQNQSIDDSDADLAKDLRRLVRERIAAGDSNGQVKEYLVNRYGEFVLLKPVFSFRNALLWLMPMLALLAGILMARRFFRSLTGTAAPAVAELSAQEKAELDKVLGDR